MNKVKILTVINSIILLAVILTMGFYFLESNSKEDIYYVDNIILFNEFNMTKETKAIEEKKMFVVKKDLDSLYNEYQKIDDKKSGQAKQFQAQIAYKDTQLQKLQAEYTTNLGQKIWDRLNNYISEYSKEKDIKVLLGTSGHGNIMYANEAINITDSVLEYVNKKYEGNSYNFKNK